MQSDGLNAGRNRDRNSNGANSRGPTINQGAQHGINIFGGTFTNHGIINLGPGIGGNGAMHGDILNRGLNTDGNLGGNGEMQGDRLNRGLNTDGNLGGNGAMQGDRLKTGLNTDGNLGANREGDDMIDAAPVEQMEELQIGPFQDKADGRLLVVDEKYLEEVIVESVELQSGSTGKVFRSKEIIEEWGFRIVIKKIQCKGSKLQSVVNEVVAARMKHQGIVPLLAKTNYEDKDQYTYFVFPYMENGDLMNAIGEDMKRISNKEEVHMGARQRVLILYQIACAMCFIHKPVKDFRGAVFHGDVTTKNIVLDKEYNARLLDFGVARELEIGEYSIQSKTGEPIGTPGYITVLSKKELSPNSDCTNFGVVILELLTGEIPYKKDWELREEFLKLGKQFDTIHGECYERVWKNNHSVYDKLKNLAGTCLKKETDSKSLARSLYEILTDDFNYNWEGESGETTMQSSVEEPEKSKKKREKSKKKRCSLCIINWAVNDLHNLRLDGCVIEKKHKSPSVCVACMRNSYLNPIMCRRCSGTIQTNIGYLVAGKREIRFDHEEGNYYVPIEDGLLCEMSELRNLLLENILKRKFNGDVKNWSDYWKDNEKRWQTFSSAIRVRITKGPHPQHTSELITIQQVVDAWNKKFELKFGFRDIQNIEKGKVVVIPEKMSTQQVIEVFRTIKDRYKDCLELDAVDEKTKVTILYHIFFQQKGHTDVQVPKWLKEIMLSIIRNQKLQEAEKLIITILPKLENERLMMEIQEQQQFSSL